MPTDRSAVTSAGLADLLSRSEAARSSGAYREGQELADRAVVVATELGDDAALARGLQLVCNQALRLGQVEEAARSGVLSVVAAERCGDAVGVVQALNLLAFAYMQLALYDEALVAMERSVRQVADLDDPDLRSNTFSRAGTLKTAMGDVTSAAELLDRAEKELTAAGTVPEPETLFCVLTNQADVVIATARLGLEVSGEDLRLGIQRAEQSLVLAIEAENPYRRALSHLNIGTLRSYVDGDEEAAEAEFEAAMSLIEEHGYLPLQLGVLDAYAVSAQRRNQHEEALATIEQLIALAEQVRDPGVLAAAHLLASTSWEQLGDFKHALESHRRFHDLETAQRTQAAETRSQLLGVTVELQRLRSETSELVRSAREDVLTGVGNRRLFDEMMPDLVAGAAADEWVCVMLLDIDHFKGVNDSFGHATGDVVLRTLGLLLRSSVRRADLLARIGGEEFVLVWVLRDWTLAERLGEQLRSRIATFDWPSIVQDLRVTVSMGIAGSPGQVLVSPTELLARADKYLYAAKAAGRNRVHLEAPV